MKNRGFSLAIVGQVLVVFFSVQTVSFAFSTQNSTSQTKTDKWLKERFSEQHMQIIPIVAVADMFFACNQDRQIDKQHYPIKYLVEEMDKQLLADKLQQCLADDTMQSDVAINYGLTGCFHVQLANLPEQERLQKMKLVKQAISSLSREQRQQSLTQCITDQAIGYLR